MTTPWQPPGPPVPSSPIPSGAEDGEVRPQPRYGEYAPPGYVSPVPPQPVAPPVAPPVLQQPAAPAQPYAGYPQPGQPPVYYATPPVVRRVKTADVVVTCVLLFLALIGTTASFAWPVFIEGGLRAASTQYGATQNPQLALGGIANIVWITHLVLFLVALGVSIPLMVKRRLAFYVPLIAGFLAGIIFLGTFYLVLFSNTDLSNVVTQH